MESWTITETTQRKHESLFSLPNSKNKRTTFKTLKVIELRLLKQVIKTKS